MTLTNEIRAKMMQWEGCRLKAYRCPAGVLTIGFGHTGPDVTEGMTITAPQAVALFNGDVDKFASFVEASFQGVTLKQKQFDALVSLAYNIGLAGLKKSTLYKKVKANPDDPTIRTEFMKHVNARVNGVLKPLPGLVKRRKAEADHYFGQI
ncbi:lysozyme [uncultured Muribaculum sp.]|jgi:lysozyme|uniref:lysozyme n=1 Tax=uncultured Muribaculum sp. TaxID=1918613 RepID=UPI0025B0CEB3|nr:lysozyme [uncultured Muribaculum sp.]